MDITRIRQNRWLSAVRKAVPQKLINLIVHLPKAVLANLFYNFPAKKIKVIGVTGTDGKTTTACLIHHILTTAGKKAGLITSVEVKFGRRVVPTGLHVTSPNPLFLQKYIRKMVDNGFEYLVLEVTSHGLDQFRVWGIDYQVGVLTNITNEHLDYHKSFKQYLGTKAKLLLVSKITIINQDDFRYQTVKAILGKTVKKVTYGLNKGDYNLNNLPISTSLIGDYNKSNCLAAGAACRQLGISKKEVLSAITSFKGVYGRMNFIPNNKNIVIAVDFAHTSNGLKQALLCLRELSRGRLISVFGCAGLRDYHKRPVMGKISGQLADITIITAEDPRTEDINKINRAIEQGLKKAGAVKKNQSSAISHQSSFMKNINHLYYIIPDRQEAIDFALTALAKKGDVVGIFGKGHEQSMCIGTVEYPWSDHQAVNNIFRKERSE